MAAPLEHVRHHRSYVSAVLDGSLGSIRCWTTRTLLPIHPRWIPKYVIHIYYLFMFLYNSNWVK
jgi:hypothetical protein